MTIDETIETFERIQAQLEAISVESKAIREDIATINQYVGRI